MEEVEVYNTELTQVVSLCRFMRKLGYVVNNYSPIPRGLSARLSIQKGFKRIEDIDIFSKRNPNFVSMEDAIQLHNCFMSRNVGDNMESLSLKQKMRFKKSTMGSARDARIVEMVKIQRHKKGSLGIKVYDHMVKYINKGKK